LCRLATDVGTKNASQNTRTYTGTFDCLSKTFRREGISGIYAGFGISLAGAMIFKALYFGTYDSIKHSYQLEDASVFIRFVIAQVKPTHLDLMTICNLD
jgi:solute carrier family 25 (adenine nucleotide translocator) protein 4/5/6/31